jgi:hypothetical protein
MLSLIITLFLSIALLCNLFEIRALRLRIDKLEKK